MKTTDLKNILKNQYDREQLIHLAVEMYKIIPKAKKEYHEIDTLIFNPYVKEVEKAKKQAEVKGEIDWATEATAIESFVEYARAGYFFSRNSFVTSKEQSNWRFTVRKWVKDLTNPKAIKQQPELKGELMYKLYTIVSENYSYNRFPSDDSFRSVGVPQVDFYRQTLMLLSTQKRNEEFLERATSMIIDNSISDECSSSSLADILAQACVALQITTNAIELLVQKLRKLDVPDPADRRSRSTIDFKNKQTKIYFTEMGFCIYVLQKDYDAAVSFFNTHYADYNNDLEIKLYSLVLKMARYKFPLEYLTEQIDNYMAMGIKPRDTIMRLYNSVKETGALPQTFRG